MHEDTFLDTASNPRMPIRLFSPGTLSTGTALQVATNQRRMLVFALFFPERTRPQVKFFLLRDKVLSQTQGLRKLQRTPNIQRLLSRDITMNSYSLPPSDPQHLDFLQVDSRVCRRPAFLFLHSAWHTVHTSMLVFATATRTDKHRNYNPDCNEARFASDGSSKVMPNSKHYCEIQSQHTILETLLEYKTTIPEIVTW